MFRHRVRILCKHGFHHNTIVHLETTKSIPNRFSWLGNKMFLSSRDNLASEKLPTHNCYCSLGNCNLMHKKKTIGYFHINFTFHSTVIRTEFPQSMFSAITLSLLVFFYLICVILVQYNLQISMFGQWRIQGGPRGPCPPGPIKISHKKMAAGGGHMDFMSPPPTRPLDPLLLADVYHYNCKVYIHYFRKMSLNLMK